MNRKDNPKQPPAYPLTPSIYELILNYWMQQVHLGRVHLGRVEAMHELITAGASANNITPTPQTKTRKPQLNAPARS